MALRNSCAVGKRLFLKGSALDSFSPLRAEIRHVEGILKPEGSVGSEPMVSFTSHNKTKMGRFYFLIQRTAKSRATGPALDIGQIECLA